MIRNISIGVDIGSMMTKIVVGEFVKGEQNPKIIGVGESETRGVRHGYITNINEATLALEKAKEAAERSSGVKIKRAFVSIGGVTLKSEEAKGEAVISKADGEVTGLDINKALEECEDSLNLRNKKVLRSIPISFKLDGNDVLGRPEGLRGTKLEVRALFITCSLAHFEDLMEVVSNAGIDPVDVVPAPLSSARIALKERQRIVGGALVDIGAETTSLAVFEDNSLSALFSFPIGGVDITNDIALGLKISLENAEGAKCGVVGEDYSRRKLEEIIEARLSDVFELIENQLKKIKRNELLPAGIIFVGGSSNINTIIDHAKNSLKLPATIGSTEIFGNIKTKLRDPAWFTALGLVLPDTEEVSYGDNSFGNAFKSFKKALGANLKQLMP